MEENMKVVLSKEELCVSKWIVAPGLGESSPTDFLWILLDLKP